MKDDRLMLYSGNDQMEAAMLRSVLLFNGRVESPKRQDMFLKAVLAIIIYGQGTTKEQDIVEVLSQRFKIEVGPTDMPQHLSKLSKRGLIKQNDDGTIEANFYDKSRVDFFIQLKADTQKLIDGVFGRIRKGSFITIPEREKIALTNNIKSALSCYYSMYGYKYFGVTQQPENEKIVTAVDKAREGLSKTVGQAAVRALADLIQSPSEEEQKTLEMWARAYVTMEMMNLDPMLRNFKQTKMSQKEFVIDTDVALHAITTHAKHSKDYRIMVERLKASRCKIYIPDRVVDEILDHTDAAWKWYGSLGPQIVDLTEELLDNKIANVFIEDYVRQIQENPSKKDMPFDVYLENFRSEEHPSLIWDSLTEVFGEEVATNKFNLVTLDDEVKNKLQSKVLAETQMTQKGSRRSEEKNEEIAELDTALYLTLLQMNKDEKGDEKPLSRRTYLLTGSDRTNKCAKDVDLYENDICCDPKALLAMMQETGSLEGHKVEIINLFENPFLVFTANEVWKEVQPLLDNGARFKYVELRKMRLDVDTHIDRILTCKTREERILEAQRQSDRGYLFARDLVDANQTIAAQERTISEQDSTIQSQNEQIADLKAELEKRRQQDRKDDYQWRVKNAKGIKGQKGKKKRKP